MKHYWPYITFIFATPVIIFLLVTIQDFYFLKKDFYMQKENIYKLEKKIRDLEYKVQRLEK